VIEPEPGPSRVARAARRSAVLVAGALGACGPRVDPPGRSMDRPEPVTLTAKGAPRADAPPPEPPRDEPKSMLPSPEHSIASIAMRTWIYSAPAERAQKIGYLRAGAVMQRGGASAGTEGCAGGWYRIEPRGYVCVGKGASLSLDHPVVKAAVRGPSRAGAAPYPYVLSRSPPPHLYFRLPTREQQERAEGSSVWAHVGTHTPPIAHLAKDPVPTFLAEGRVLEKPYGADKSLAFLASGHMGRAREASAFGLVTTFESTGRRFGLTTELDIIPLDRTKPAVASELRGAIATKGGVPVLVMHHGAKLFRLDAAGVPHEAGSTRHRQGFELTGKNKGGERGLLETTEGLWIAAESLAVPELRQDPRGFAAAGRKWIDVSIKQQLLVAYEGLRPVFTTLVSSGRGGMADPEETTATVRGTFLIHAKHVSGTMDGDEGSDSFDLRDVPFIQYFHKGYALHGAYWHDEFGRPRSHGCINLSPRDAAWLFEWTEPRVPPEWHGAVSLAEGGTLIWIHG
jgi:hypothetical protein